MVVPVGAGTFRDALRMGAEVSMPSSDLHDAALSTAVGDEGGFASTWTRTRPRSRR